jgi:hypothetical protein
MDPVGTPPASTPPTTPAPSSPTGPPPSSTIRSIDDVDRDALQRLLAQRKAGQSLALGSLGGIIGAAIGAAIWAALTLATHYQIGYMAVGVGFLTGFGVRIFGKGIDPVFGYMGAVLALAGCLAGNILTMMLVVSQHEHIALSVIASKMTPQLAWLMLTSDFNIIDLLFYGLAVFAGYRYSFHHITQAELEAMPRSNPGAA